MASRAIADRLAVCSWSLEPGSPQELVDALRQAELDRINLALVPLVTEDAWADAGSVLSNAGIELVGGMMAGVGEDYSTLESIRRTGGVVPDETWPKMRENAEKVAPLAKDLGLGFVMFHAGFIPHGPSEPGYEKVLGRVREIADLFGNQGISVGLETGQEDAPALLEFFKRLERPNVGVNFDPANMILYGVGDPIEALRTVGPHVQQVHIKDGKWTKTPGTWGEEVVVGEGDVDWSAFFKELDAIGYDGELVIEREAGNQRVADVRAAADFVKRNAG